MTSPSGNCLYEGTKMSRRDEEFRLSWHARSKQCNMMQCNAERKNSAVVSLLVDNDMSWQLWLAACYGICDWLCLWSLVCVASCENYATFLADRKMLAVLALRYVAYHWKLCFRQLEEPISTSLSHFRNFLKYLSWLGCQIAQFLPCYATLRAVLPW